MRFVALILAFHFLLGSCFPGTDFSQLRQLPDLMEHFEAHQREAIEAGASLSLTDFLWMHFVHPSDHDHPEEHQQLPLQVINSVVLDLVPTTLPEVSFRESGLLTLSSPLREISCIPSDCSFSLLRPPIESMG